ncbi:MAG: hypothetical protein KJ597_05050 [Nanoarchaeota archaeon]|nr:hypothetical protein [Nanoarchaeota archaeon]
MEENRSAIARKRTWQAVKELITGEKSLAECSGWSHPNDLTHRMGYELSSPLEEVEVFGEKKTEKSPTIWTIEI